jgi:hypothetical protein
MESRIGKRLSATSSRNKPLAAISHLFTVGESGPQYHAGYRKWVEPGYNLSQEEVSRAGNPSG